MKKLFIESLSENLTMIQKMDFESIDQVFNVLDDAFHSHESVGDEPDNRFLSLWTLFLSLVGWTEDEFWFEWDLRKENFKCPECKKKELEEQSTDSDLSEKKSN